MTNHSSMHGYNCAIFKVIMMFLTPLYLTDYINLGANNWPVTLSK